MLGPEALRFHQEHGHCLREATSEQQSTRFLLQRVSVAVLQGNAAVVLGTLKGSVDLVFGGVLTD